MTFIPLGRIAMMLVGIVAIAPLSSATAESKLTFEADIQPLLNEKCGKCHSQTVRKGGLDLSSMAAVRRGGESGEPLLAADIGDSLLWIMLDGGGMPPDDQPQLDDAQLHLIREWLQAGAPSETPAAVTDRPLTQHDVLPIMLLRCTTCHGPRLKQNGLDLRTRTTMLR
ncbi:MAG: c-type cytochrome, partial [Planctomycetales bacterium]|nr:c-type cytochrome [Planctomycetales bacterium]